MSGNDPGNPGRSDEDAEDVRLMKLVSHGDTSAFETLVQRHQSLVGGTVAHMLGSNSDVEDIAQQVFIRVWKSARRYVPRAKFTTWLLKITRNLVFNELRRSKRHAHIPLQTDPGAEEFPLKDEKILRRYEQLSYEEISEVLDLSVPAVKSVLFRARTELRARLSRYLG